MFVFTARLEQRRRGESRPGEDVAEGAADDEADCAPGLDAHARRVEAVVRDDDAQRRTRVGSSAVVTHLLCENRSSLSTACSPGKGIARRTQAAVSPVDQSILDPDVAGK